MKLPNFKKLDRHPVGLILENPARLSPTGYERLLNAFLHGRSPKTRKAYIEDLRDLSRFLGHDNVIGGVRFFFSDGCGFANTAALGFKDHLLVAGRSPATINRKLASLRSLVKMARTIGLVAWSLEIENVRAESYRDTSGPGITAIADVIKYLGNQKDAKSVRDFAIIRLLFDLGLRRGEVAALDLLDVALAESKLMVLGQGRREKVVMSLAPETVNALTSWLAVRDDQPGPLFTNFDRAKKGCRLTGTSIYRLVMSLGRKVGKAMRPHGIRHTAVTEACKAAAREGIPLEEVTQFSRHNDIRTLMIYRDHETNRQGQLSSLVARATGVRVLGKIQK